MRDSSPADGAREGNPQVFPYHVRIGLDLSTSKKTVQKASKTPH